MGQQHRLSAACNTTEPRLPCFVRVQGLLGAQTAKLHGTIHGTNILKKGHILEMLCAGAGFAWWGSSCHCRLPSCLEGHAMKMFVTAASSSTADS